MTWRNVCARKTLSQNAHDNCITWEHPRSHRGAFSRSKSSKDGNEKSDLAMRGKSASAAQLDLFRGIVAETTSERAARSRLDDRDGNREILAARRLSTSRRSPRR